MSTTRKAPLLVATASLGLIAATAIVVYWYAASSNRSSGQQPQQQTSDRSAAEKHTSSAMQKAEGEEEEVVTPPAPPLAIAPASAGFKALVVCADGGEEATVAAAWASASRGAGAAVSVCPPGFLGSHAGASAGTYDSIVVEDGERVSGAALGEVLKLLKAGGKVSVIVSPANTTTTTAAAAAAATKRALTFAGFIEVAPSPEDGRALVGKRAPWDAGASAPVRVSFRRTKPAPEVNGVGVSNGSGGGGGDRQAQPVAQPVKKTWTLALDDDDVEGEDGGGMFGAGGGAGGGEDDDLVDEDALLEDSAPVKRASEADATGCATKRRACKDCSCGRAEMEEAGEAGAPPRPVASIADVDDALTSACGNCSKGDAFRCGSCPFLGKPTFEKGQEKLIMLSDLDSQQDD